MDKNVWYKHVLPFLTNMCCFWFTVPRGEWISEGNFLSADRILIFSKMIYPKNFLSYLTSCQVRKVKYLMILIDSIFFVQIHIVASHPKIDCISKYWKVINWILFYTYCTGLYPATCRFPWRNYSFTVYIAFCTLRKLFIPLSVFKWAWR